MEKGNGRREGAVRGGGVEKGEEKISGEGFLQTQTTAYPKTRDGE